MRKLIGLFTNHPSDMGETYFQHFFAAICVSFKLTLSSYMLIIHAIFPFICPPLGCDVRSIIKYLENRLPENKKDRK